MTKTPDPSDPSDPKRPGKGDSQSQPYDLDLPEDEPRQDAGPGKGSSASKPRSEAKPEADDRAADGGDEAYELDEPADDKPAPPPRSLSKDPRVASSAPSESSASTGAEAAGKADASGSTDSDKPQSAVYTPSSAEPEYVDPDTASTRREEYRRQAAEDAATEHAKRQRIKFIVALVFAGLVLVFVVYRFLF